jgi:hypothetical protein
MREAFVARMMSVLASRLPWAGDRHLLFQSDIYDVYAAGAMRGKKSLLTNRKLVDMA